MSRPEHEVASPVAIGILYGHGLNFVDSRGVQSVEHHGLPYLDRGGKWWGGNDLISPDGADWESVPFRVQSQEHFPTICSNHLKASSRLRQAGFERK
jgi:hypothetical protein